MAIINRGTLQQKITDFINRVSPFTAPLIQKSEDLEVRTDVLDSVIFRIPTIGSISSPAATFTADFATNDEININSAASIAASFNVTLANLRGNSIGKLNITKKTNDTYVFANAQIIPHNTAAGQTGTTVLNLLVINTDTGYFVIPAYNVRVPLTYLDVVAATAISSLTNGRVQRSFDGVCQISGILIASVQGSQSFPFTIATINNPLFRPVVDSFFTIFRQGASTSRLTIGISTTGVIQVTSGDILQAFDLSSIMFINANV